MANSISFHQPTHRFISCPQVLSSVLAMSTNLSPCSLLHFLFSFSLLWMQVKGFRSFSSPRFSNYPSTSPKSRLRPIKAATETAAFPLLQPPKADESSPSEVRKVLCQSNVLYYLLFVFHEQFCKMI